MFTYSTLDLLDNLHLHHDKLNNNKNSKQIDRITFHKQTLRRNAQTKQTNKQTCSKKETYRYTYG